MKLHLTKQAIINGKFTFGLAWKRALKYKAIPKSSRTPTNRRKMLAIYIKAQIKNFGSRVKYEVDHIIPLYHPDVCGLHTHLNLQILSKAKNQAKSNIFVPYRELDGRKYYYKAVNNSTKTPKIPKKYNQTKKTYTKLVKKRAKYTKFKK